MKGGFLNTIIFLWLHSAFMRMVLLYHSMKFIPLPIASLTCFNACYFEGKNKMIS